MIKQTLILLTAIMLCYACSNTDKRAKFDTNQTVRIDTITKITTDFTPTSTFARRTIPRRFSKERIRLFAFATMTNNDRKFE